MPIPTSGFLVKNHPNAIKPVAHSLPDSSSQELGDSGQCPGFKGSAFGKGTDGVGVVFSKQKLVYRDNNGRIVIMEGDKQTNKDPLTSLDHLPAIIEQNVQRIADELQIPRDEALLKVIETGITFIKPTPAPTMESEESRIQAFLDEPLNDEEAELIYEVAEARRKRSAVRIARREALARSRPEAPDALIGFLADAPEVAENIRMVAQERRRQAFSKL